MLSHYERINNVFYDAPYNSDKYFKLHFHRQFSNTNPDEFSQGRHMVFSAKAHNDYFMVLSFGDLIVCNGEQTFSLKPSDILIWHPNGKQILNSPFLSTFHLFIFSGKCAGEILSSLNLKCNTVYSLADEFKSPRLISMYSKQISYVHQELVSKRNKYSDVISSSMFIEFLGLYSRNILTSENNKNNNIIQDIINEIFDKKSIADKFDVDEIIKNTHMARSTFYVLFKKHTGMSLVQYINDKRLSLAADYLSVLNFPISEVAAKVGFDDPMYFGKLFKRKYNMTPSEYRKLYKQHNFIIDSLADAPSDMTEND